MDNFVKYPDFLLIHGDTNQVVRNLVGQVSAIFADPPYFLSGGGKTVRGNRVVVQDYGMCEKR